MLSRCYETAKYEQAVFHGFFYEKLAKIKEN